MVVEKQFDKVDGQQMQNHNAHQSLKLFANGSNFRSGLFKYTTEVTPEILVDIYHGSQCQIADTDIRHPDLMDLGGVQVLTSWLMGHGT